MEGLNVLPGFPPGFWTLEKGEWVLYLLNILFIVVVWIIGLAGPAGAPGVLSYWDGPNYIYAGLTLYRIPDDNPWTLGFKYPPSYFACHFPGLPLVIRLLSTFALNNAIIGTYATVIAISTLLLYVFKRLLIIYNITEKPLFLTGVLVLLPLRYAVYHSVVASEPLFMLFCFLAFIFFRVNKMIPLFLSICGACITRIEGLAIWGTIGLCYLLRRDLLRAIVIGFTLIAPASVFLMHQFRFGTWMAYFEFNQGQQGIISLPPLREFLLTHKYSRDLREILAHDTLLAPFFIGTAMTLVTCVPLGIFSTVYLLYVSCLHHIDTFRYALPGFVLAVVVGFAKFWESREVASVAPIFAVVHVPMALWYIKGQLHSNYAPKWFAMNVLRTSPVYF